MQHRRTYWNDSFSLQEIILWDFLVYSSPFHHFLYWAHRTWFPVSFEKLINNIKSFPLVRFAYFTVFDLTNSLQRNRQETNQCGWAQPGGVYEYVQYLGDPGRMPPPTVRWPGSQCKTFQKPQETISKQPKNKIVLKYSMTILTFMSLNVDISNCLVLYQLIVYIHVDIPTLKMLFVVQNVSVFLQDVIGFPLLFSLFYPQAWRWVLGPLVIYFFERVVRFWRSTQKVAVSKVTWQSFTWQSFTWQYFTL